MTNKATINILCVLILGCLVLSAVGPVYTFTSSFFLGFSKGIENGPDSVLADCNMVDTEFLPTVDNVINPVDSIRTASGQAIPIVHSQGLLYIPKDAEPLWITMVTGVLLVVQAALVVLLIIQFIKFIVQINRNKVFIWKNVIYLRRCGFLTLGISAVIIFFGCLSDYSFSQLGISIPGYELNALWSFPWQDIIIALVALLMAQIWERGIKLREEQELTI